MARFVIDVNLPLKMREFHLSIASRWEAICDLSRQCKLVRVFEDRIEGVD